PHVVTANVLSGFVLMGYLHRAARDQHPFGLSALRGHPLLTQGLITGLVGAGVVALWFFALDVAAGHPLRTPAALGAALLFGATLALGAQWVLGTLGVWSVLVANVLAVCAMGWYVWATHPLLRRRLHEEVQVHV